MNLQKVLRSVRAFINSWSTKDSREREGNENDLSQGRAAVGQHSRESKESLC